MPSVPQTGRDMPPVVRDHGFACIPRFAYGSLSGLKSKQRVAMGMKSAPAHPPGCTGLLRRINRTSTFRRLYATYHFPRISRTTLKARITRPAMLEPPAVFRARCADVARNRCSDDFIV